MRLNYLRGTLALVTTALITAAVPAYGNPVTLDLYHLGESDPGAVAGNAGNPSTIDSGPLAHNVPVSGTPAPTYSNNVGPPGSTLSMAFGGTSDYHNAAIATGVTNVGIDAWIYPTANNIIATIAYNGNSGSNGFGLYQFNGGTGVATVIALLGGVTLGPSVDIPLNAWSEVTQVVQGGLDQIYLNGVLAGQQTKTANALDGSSFLGIGGHGGEYFQGNIDEVRIFSTVPEPTALGVLAVAGTSLLARTRRRASTRAVPAPDYLDSKPRPLGVNARPQAALTGTGAARPRAHARGCQSGVASAPHPS